MLDMPMDALAFENVIIHENFVSTKQVESRKCELFESDLSFFDMLATGLCSGSASSAATIEPRSKNS